MKDNYDFCIKKVLISEGGYTNDPADPGGPTNYGITIHDYRAYINPHGTAHDVRNMSVEQAKEIYKSKYWDTVNGDNLPAGVDYTVFDYGVNSGVSRSLRVYKNLRRDSPTETIKAINDERLRFLHSLRTWPHFGRGWQSRVASVRKDSLWLTTQTPSLPQQPTPSPTTSLPPSLSKVSPTLWQKIFSMVLSNVNALIALWQQRRLGK